MQRKGVLYPKIGTLYFGVQKKKPAPPKMVPMLVERPATKGEKMIADKIVDDMLNGVMKLNTPTRIQKYGTKNMEEIISKLRRMELERLKKNGVPIAPPSVSPKKMSPAKPVRNDDNFTLKEIKDMLEDAKKKKKSEKKKVNPLTKIKEKVKKDMKKLQLKLENDIEEDKKQAIAKLKAFSRKKMQVIKPVSGPELVKEVKKNLVLANEQIKMIKNVLNKNKVPKVYKRPVKGKQRWQMKPASPNGSVKSVGSVASVASVGSRNSVGSAGSRCPIGYTGSVCSSASRSPYSRGGSPVSPVDLFKRMRNKDNENMLKYDDPKQYIKKLGYNNTRIARKSKKVPEPYRQKNLMNIAKALNIKVAGKSTNTELRKLIRSKID